MLLQVKPGIMDIVPYQGGKSKVDGKQEIIKLSSNENPYGPSQHAIDAYNDTAKVLYRYPEGEATLLRDAIAEVYKFNKHGIVCGAGSDEIISFICRAFAGSGDEVIYTEHGFLMYPIAAKAVGATPVAVKEKNLTTDIDAILAAVTSNTKIVFIANPNNPTGTYLGREKVKTLRNKLPESVLLVLDGAYAEYVTVADYTSGKEIVDSTQNTILTGTFSKIYGLAGLRVGWGYCSAEVALVLHRVRGPFNVSSSGINAAVAAVRDVEYTKKICDLNQQCRNLLHEGLQAIGLSPVESHANFILVKFPGGAEQAEAANQFLLQHGVIVRKVDNYGLPEYLRITVGTKDDCKLVIDLLKEIVSI